MNNETLITCVIPTYRRPKMVARAIRSVLNQTFRRLIVFVTDNASGDETEETVLRIQAQDDRVIYHRQPKNLGMAANFFYGMSQVKTPFYSLLSDDDVLLPEFYEIAYAEFQKYPEAILVATKVPSVIENGQIISEPLSLWDRFGLFNPPSGAYRVAAFSHFQIPGTLFRSEFLKTSYAFPDPNIHAGDYEIIFDAALHYPIVTVDRPGAFFIQHDGPRALPDNPFSIINYYKILINRVDQDQTFPTEIKIAHRKKLQTLAYHYLGSLFLRFISMSDYKGAKEAIDMLDGNIGYEYQAKCLKIYLHLFHMIPPLRPLVRAIPIVRNWYNRLKMPYINAKYKEMLELR